MRPIKYQLSDLQLDSTEEEKPGTVFQINTPRIDIRRAMEKVETAIAAKDKKKTDDVYNLIEIVKPKQSLYDEYVNFLNPKRVSPSKTIFGIKFHEQGYEPVSQKTFSANVKSPDTPNLLYNYTPKLDMPIFILPRSSMKINIDKRASVNKNLTGSKSHTNIAMRATSTGKSFNIVPKKKLLIDTDNSLSKTQNSMTRPQTKFEMVRTATAGALRHKFAAVPVREGTLPQLLGFKKKQKIQPVRVEDF